MAGYTRQSVADIIANAVIKAAPVNAEYNAIRDAFAASTGHKHDGSTGEGGYVPLIGDSDALNKVVIDTSNNRIGFFNEVSAAAVEQVRIQDGVLKPVTDNDIDLGATGAEFKDLYVDGIGYIDSVVVGDNAYLTITDNEIDVSSGDLTLDVAGDIVLDADGGDVTLKDAGTTYANLKNSSGELVLQSGSTPTTAITFSGANADFAGTVDVTGAVTLDSTLAVTGTTALTGTATITSADINSGAMDNTTIGGSTPAAGTFTNLTASGTTTITTADINGGNIDGTTIGSSSAGAGTFTNLTSTGT